MEPGREGSKSAQAHALSSLPAQPRRALPAAHSPPTRVSRLAPRASRAPETRIQERARCARAQTSGPGRAPAHELPRRAGCGVIRGGALGGRAAGGGRRYGASVVTWPLVTAATPSRPVLFQVGPGPAASASAWQTEGERERKRRGGGGGFRE